MLLDRTIARRLACDSCRCRRATVYYFPEASAVAEVYVCCLRLGRRGGSRERMEGAIATAKEGMSASATPTLLGQGRKASARGRIRLPVPPT